jgi:holo-[acyl-carrier protein] synthase
VIGFPKINLAGVAKSARGGSLSRGLCEADAMIVGVGIDVVDVGRFEETLVRSPGLRERVFTDGERTRRPASLAARFAAKEALAKALGAPAGLAWQDAEVVTSEDGRPWFEVRGSVAERCTSLGVAHIHLSLSHDAGMASAVVVLEAVPVALPEAELSPGVAAAGISRRSSVTTRDAGAGQENPGGAAGGVG